MRLFSHPVNHFLSTWRNFFRCVSFQSQCRDRNCTIGTSAFFVNIQSPHGDVKTLFF
ncbi:hypothetical protein KL86DES1_10173 [uncultured Desulfovibrio sp.]|uniref:Uncharacterized protein n=1 Tax=uncultured Desulfovibrio sp. TaxID=167968 RepID=A0A212KXT3_9BACT|nr:hypothetical protein KL86DES1_10173 [uncultured Desulfovibrio sp.]VZH35386.1 conserved protein of unknown function [Desulfovibrio sp. 86]